MGDEGAYSVGGFEFDSFTATDEETLMFLEEKSKRWAERGRLIDSPHGVNGGGLSRLDPCHLPACFLVTAPELSARRQTEGGHWKETHFIGIRDPRTISRRYVGSKRTLQFCETSGAKTDWFMYEYHLLNNGTYFQHLHEMVLQEELVMRKVFQRNKDWALCHLSRLLQLLTVDSDGEEQHNNGDQSFDKELEDKMEKFMPTFSNLLGEGGSNGDMRSGKYPMSSAPNVKAKVWLHFTKIRTKDPRVVYAVCHYCDRVLKAHSSNGTSTLIRHYKERCPCKHLRPSSR